MRRLSQWYFYSCIIMCLLVTSLPYWPYYQWLIIPKYILLFLPRWWLVLLIVAILFFGRQLSKKQRLLLFPLLFLSFNYLDFQLPSIKAYSKNSNKADITMLSANVGEGASISELQRVADDFQPDLIILQEARHLALSKSFYDYKFKECIVGLCVISKYPIKQINKLARKWGYYAVTYVIESQVGTINLANVHFDTPRSVLSELSAKRFDVTLAKKVENKRIFQAELLSLWADDKTNILMVGDFNMPEDENIYQDNFSKLHNALDVKGIGFNGTKHTQWHSIRIDHVLFSDSFQVLEAKVIPSKLGDHRPIVTRFKLNRF